MNEQLLRTSLNKQQKVQMNEITADSSANSKTTSADGTHADEAALALKSSVTADAHDLADKAKEVGGGVISHARQSAEAQITGGKDRVAEGLTSVADAIRHTGEHLRSQDKSGLTEYVARAADQVEAASDYLQGRSLGEVMTDVGSFARREPAIFLGTAFALGLIGGRFLKSSKVSPTQPAMPQLSASGAQPSGAGGSHQPQRRKTLPRPSTRATVPEPRRAPNAVSSDNGGYGSGGSATKLPGAE